MRNATLLFLIKRRGGAITEVCLAMKKRGFGKGRWNGVGGKVDPDESIESATIREAREEIGVVPRGLKKIAELSFTFAHNPDWNQVVHTYFTETWDGDPTESEEMAPRWYAVADIPYADMWPDDIFWLSRALKDEFIQASFTFGEGDAILDQDVKSVEFL